MAKATAEPGERLEDAADRSQSPNLDEGGPICLDWILQRGATFCGEKIVSYSFQCEGGLSFNNDPPETPLEKSKREARELKRHRRWLRDKDKREELERTYTTRKVIGLVYFVKDERRVKIGFSTNLLKRMQTLQGHSGLELEVLLTLEGKTIRDEKNLHKRFAKDRIRKGNEWFRLSDEILAFIEQEKAKQEHEEHRRRFGMERASFGIDSSIPGHVANPLAQMNHRRPLDRTEGAE